MKEWNNIEDGHTVSIWKNADISSFISFDNIIRGDDLSSGLDSLRHTCWKKLIRQTGQLTEALNTIHQTIFTKPRPCIL